MTASPAPTDPDPRLPLAVACDGLRTTPDGRVTHSFTKLDGLWHCTCGEVRDRYGRTVRSENVAD